VPATTTRRPHERAVLVVGHPSRDNGVDMQGLFTGRKQDFAVLDRIVDPVPRREKALQRRIDRRVFQIDTDDPVGIDHFAAVRETQVALPRDFVHHGFQLRPLEAERHVLRGETGEGEQTG